MPLRLNSFAKSVLSRISKRSALRRSIRFESLEARFMMTVSSQLANGVLDIGFDGNKDDAVVAVVGNQLNVTSDGNTA